MNSQKKRVFLNQRIVSLACGLFAVVLTFQQCSNVQLTNDLSQKLSGAAFQGSFCFPYSVKSFQRYQLGDFYALNLTTRNVMGKTKIDANMNGISDDQESNVAAPTVRVNNVDTDNDGLPDFIETLKGLNPSQNELDQDGYDRDGVTNKKELQQGTDPEFYDLGAPITEYSIDTLESSAANDLTCGEGQSVYHFNISHINTQPMNAFSDTTNPEGAFNLSHAENENVILLLFRMKSDNVQLSDYFYAKILKIQAGVNPNILVSPQEFQLLPLASSVNCDQCDNQPLKLTYSKVVTGDMHSCAMAENGKVFCWGHNQYGQLGNDSFKNSLGPVSVKLPIPAKDIVSGAFHVCAILKSDELYCWGSNSYGQGGDPSLNDLPLPQKVRTPATTTKLALGKEHSCAETSDQNIYCWGRNQFSQLGSSTGSNTFSAPPQKISLDTLITNNIKPEFPLLQITAGNDFNCITDKIGRLYCWGGYNSSILSSPLLFPATAPTNTSTVVYPSDSSTDSYVRNFFSTQGFNKVATNGRVIMTDYSPRNSRFPSINTMAVCWERNVRSLVKTVGCPSRYDEENTPNEFPYASFGLSQIVNISLSGSRGCAVVQTTASTTGLKCWGYNYESKTSVETATTVFEIVNPITVSVSGGHTCALDGNKKIWCWGYNSHGQTGAATYGEHVKPELVANQ